MFRPFAILPLIAVFAVSFGADDAAARKAIEAIEAKIVVAMKSKDMTYLKSILTDDFTVIEKKKTYTKSDWVDITTQTLKQIQIKDISFKIVTIKSTPTTATVRTKSTLTGTITLPGKKAQAIVDNSSDDETWVKTANGWKFKKDKTIDETATLDGKPFAG